MARWKRARSAADYTRRGPVREPYDFVLIVCEGQKTEPNYLDGLRLSYRLSNANIRVMHPGGTDPMTLVQFAEAEMAREGYDRAYCVFDRDGHANYDAALVRLTVSENGRAGKLFAITSVPCFEIWVLLHFKYTSAAFNSAGSQSACDKVLGEIKRHFADYTKGHPGVYGRLAERREQAVVHAARLEKENARTGSENPATKMHQLVTYLCNLKM